LASMTAVGATYGYVCDRWCVLRGSYATDSQMAQGTNISVSDLPFTEAGISTFSRISRIANTSGTSGVGCSYGLESQDSKKFVGKTITLSFYYRTGANFSSSILNGYIITGKGNDEGFQRGSSITGYQTNIATFPVSLNWSRAKYTITITDTAITQLGITFQLNPTGTAGAADYFDITGVQLELGSVATPFEVRPYPVELQMCMRYYQQFGGSSGMIVSTGFTRSTSAFFGFVYFPVEMRIGVTPTLNSGAVLNISIGGSDFSCTSVGNPGGYVPNTKVGYMGFNISGSQVGLPGYVIAYGAGVTAFIRYDAEL